MDRCASGHRSDSKTPSAAGAAATAQRDSSRGWSGTQVGQARKPQRYLADGMTLTTDIAGIGFLQNVARRR